MAVKRIVTNIPTPQADAARRFYGAVLGLAVVTAAFSLVVGTLLLVGAGSILPPMLGE